MFSNSKYLILFTKKKNIRIFSTIVFIIFVSFIAHKITKYAIVKYNLKNKYQEKVVAVTHGLTTKWMRYNPKNGMPKLTSLRNICKIDDFLIKKGQNYEFYSNNKNINIDKWEKTIFDSLKYINSYFYKIDNKPFLRFYFLDLTNEVYSKIKKDSNYYFTFAFPTQKRRDKSMGSIIITNESYESNVSTILHEMTEDTLMNFIMHNKNNRWFRDGIAEYISYNYCILQFGKYPKKVFYIDKNININDLLKARNGREEFITDKSGRLISSEVSNDFAPDDFYKNALLLFLKIEKKIGKRVLQKKLNTIISTKDIRSKGIQKILNLKISSDL